MRYFFFSSILFLFFTNLSAQAPTLYTIYGDTFGEVITDTYIDAQGNTLSCGYFNGTLDFDNGAGTAIETVSGTSLFIVKLNSAAQFQWVRVFRGSASSYCWPAEIDGDGAGNIFMTGHYSFSMDFDPGPGTFYDTASGLNIFILKLDPNGNLAWAHTLGEGEAHSIDVDANGNSYSCGYFTDTASDFDPGPATYMLTTTVHGLYYMKLNSAGNFVWANGAGNSLYEEGHAIRIDETNNNVYVTGQFSDTIDFDAGPGTHIDSTAGGNDLFVLQTDTAGNFHWVYHLPGTNYDRGDALIISPDHHAYVEGTVFSDSVDVDPGPATAMHYATGNRTFIVKLTEAGAYCWHGSVGGAFTPTAPTYGFAFDAQEQLYFHGVFNITSDLDPGAGVSLFSPNAQNGHTSYIAKLDTSNGNLMGIQLFQSDSSYVTALDLEMDAGGFPCLSGIYRGTCDFDPTSDSLYSTSESSNVDFFVVHCGLVMDVHEDPPVNSFLLYPNPGNGIFTLVLPVGVHEFGRITITDLTGRIVYSENLKNATAGMQKTIDIQNEAAGMYIMSLEMDHYSVSQKVLIGR